MRRLSQIAELRPNKKEVRDNLSDTDPVSFVPMDCLNVGTQKLSPHEDRPLATVYKSYTYFRDGDVLLAKITPCFENGKLGIARNLSSGVGFGSSEFFVIRPKEQLLPEYLYFYLEQQSFRDAGQRVMSGAVGHKRVPKEFIEHLEIPLPPLEEQRRIVAVLDKAFAGLDRARANAEANLADARELFESALSGVFADPETCWRKAELQSLGTIVTGSTPKSSEPENLGSFLPFIKPGDFLPDGSLRYDNQGLSEKGAGKARIVPAGSAMMVCIGATIGKAAFTEEPVATNQQVNAIIPKSGILGEFLYLQMLTSNFQKSVLSNAGQATLPIINKTKWSRLAVLVPATLSAQHSIVTKMQTIRSKLGQAEERFNTDLSSLDTLRQSLLQKAFSGGLS